MRDRQTQHPQCWIGRNWSPNIEWEGEFCCHKNLMLCKSNWNANFFLFFVLLYWNRKRETVLAVVVDGKGSNIWRTMKPFIQTVTIIWLEGIKVKKSKIWILHLQWCYNNNWVKYWMWRGEILCKFRFVEHCTMITSLEWRTDGEWKGDWESDTIWKKRCEI